MTKIYNIDSEKNFRRELRKNMTEPEKQLWFALRNKQFYGIKFRRQYSVGGYILDFYAPEIKLAIEVDGDSHTDNPEYEQKRTEFIESFNINIIRYTNREVLYNFEGVLLDLAMRGGYLE